MTATSTSLAETCLEAQLRKQSQLRKQAEPEWLQAAKTKAKSLGDAVKPHVKAVLGDMASILLTGQRVVPARLLEAGFKFQYPELAPALRSVLNKQAAPA